MHNYKYVSIVYGWVYAWLCVCMYVYICIYMYKGVYMCIYVYVWLYVFGYMLQRRRPIRVLRTQ